MCISAIEIDIAEGDETDRDLIKEEDRSLAVRWWRTSLSRGKFAGEVDVCDSKLKDSFIKS